MRVFLFSFPKIFFLSAYYKGGQSVAICHRLVPLFFLGCPKSFYTMCYIMLYNNCELKTLMYKKVHHCIISYLSLKTQK